MAHQRSVVSVSQNGFDASIIKQDALDHLESLRSGSVDLFVTSPPYCIGKEYESSTSTKDFVVELDRVFGRAVEVVKEGGSLCWQVGSHVTANVTVPLDFLIYEKSLKFPQLRLRNRIIWHFGHGIHANKRLSGRHETILWFTKGDQYYFDLDAIRVEQKYPGKKYYKGPKKGKYSSNPRGKNPSDVWDIPNVKANHVEKTEHPCQFPVALVRRLVKGMCPPGGLVCDPYSGTGSTAVAALLEHRNFTGSEISSDYVEISRERLKKVIEGSIQVRDDKPVMKPDIRSSVARRPVDSQEYV